MILYHQNIRVNTIRPYQYGQNIGGVKSYKNQVVHKSILLSVSDAMQIKHYNHYQVAILHLNGTDACLSDFNGGSITSNLNSCHLHAFVFISNLILPSSIYNLNLCHLRMLLCSLPSIIKNPFIWLLGPPQACCESVRRKTPTNFIFLTVFTGIYEIFRRKSQFGFKQNCSLRGGHAWDRFNLLWRWCCSHRCKWPIMMMMMVVVIVSMIWVGITST